MPLEVTTGPPAVAAGAGPPGLAGLTAAPPTARDPASLFAALMAQQTPISPAILPRMTSDVPSRDLKPEKTKNDNQDDAKTPQPSAAGNTDTAPINWTVLGALQPPPPVPTQNTPVTAETPVNNAPTMHKEVMDTASPSVPAAPAAMTDTASSGLLPNPASLPAPSAFPGQPTVPGITKPVEDAVTQTADLTSGTFVGETTPETSARVVPTPIAVPLISTPPPMGVDAAPVSRNAVRQDAPAAQAATPSPFPTAGGVPSGLPASVTPQIGQTPSPALLAVPVIMPAKPSQPDMKPALPRTVVRASSPAPRTPLPVSLTAQTAQAPPETPFTDANPKTPFADAARPMLSSEQTTLQNDALPANNTGRPGTAQDIQAAALNDAPLAAKAAAPSAPKAEHATDAPVAEVVKAPGIAAKQDRSTPAPPTSGGPTSVTGPGTDNDTAPPDQDAGDKAKNSAADPAVTMTTTQTASAEPKVSTTALTQKPLTGAERAQVVQQAADGISAVKPQAAATGQGQMTVQLHPQEWGDLRVTVQLAPAPAIDGVKQTTVVAHIVASSPVVKTALEKHTADLNQALRATGLHLERLSVTVQAASAGGQSGGAGGEGRNGQKSADPWQGTQAQTSAGNGEMGAGGSSSFASYSERQGGGAYHQGRPAPQSGYAGGDESEAGVTAVSQPSPRPSAGFDEKA